MGENERRNGSNSKKFVFLRQVVREFYLNGVFSFFFFPFFTLRREEIFENICCKNSFFFNSFSFTFLLSFLRPLTSAGRLRKKKELSRAGNGKRKTAKKTTTTPRKRFFPPMTAKRSAKRRSEISTPLGSDDHSNLLSFFSSSRASVRSLLLLSIVVVFTLG